MIKNIKKRRGLRLLKRINNGEVFNKRENRILRRKKKKLTKEQRDPLMAAINLKKHRLFIKKYKLVKPAKTTIPSVFKQQTLVALQLNNTDY